MTGSRPGRLGLNVHRVADAQLGRVGRLCRHGGARQSLAVRLQHPAYDCFYLALARQASCPLVTAGKRLIERCRRADATDFDPMVVSLLAAGSVP